jgi:hypothetical protein
MNACCEAVSGTCVVADGALLLRYPDAGDAEDVDEADDADEADGLDEAGESTGRSSSMAWIPGIEAAPWVLAVPSVAADRRGREDAFPAC